MYFRAEAEEQLANLQEDIQGLLTDNGRLGLAAVAHALWDDLNESSEKTE